MFLSTTVTLCLLFVPKIYALVTSGGNPVIACTGILVDNSNTRRFVFDDRKEIYYRAEVQNRVYKRELVELDQKIARLERLLELPCEHYPSVMSEMMYRMQDSSADRNRRYTREWDRCSSISDGEGMTYDYTEKQDILTEMGFISVTKPAAVTKKRSKAGELGRRGSSTLQKLTRSWSIGAGSRVRKKRQSLETPRSFVPFSSSESNFVHDSDFEVLDGRAGTNYPKGNACSNALSYIYSADATENCGLQNSLMPKSHNATQTFNSKNAFLKRGSSLKYNAHHKESSFVGDDLDGRGRRMDYRWQGRLLNSKQAKLFAVHQLHIEMVEEDSNSNVEDTESLAGSSAGCVSPCYDVSIPVLGSEAGHLKLMPSSESSCREAITWQNASPLTTFSSSIGQSDTNHLLPCEHRKMGMENLRRLSAPSPLQHKPDLPLANNFTSSTSATTTAVPKNSSSLCLVSDFKKENKICPILTFV
uniref:G-protein coupled receptors family 3 profile domain-containing protein n=1 Tax=Biomphalaria glabrata TaxID=6526 RepID=A0A2C9KEY9_BIOGL